MQPVNWGIISTALIGTAKVIPAMQKSKHCRIQAIASRDLALAKKWAKELGIPKAYGSYEELLADREIEAVYNPLPNHLHVPWTIKAAEAGKHVLCEKPLARTPDECRRMIAEAHSRRRTLATGFNYRFYPSVMKAREFFDAGAIGELDHIRSYTGYSATAHNQAWLHDAGVMGGGALRDNGIHLIDTTLYFFGDAVEVQGAGSSGVWNFPGCEDNGFALLRNAQGKIAALQASWTEWMGYKFSVELYGTNGCILIRCFPMITKVISGDVKSGRSSRRSFYFPRVHFMEHLKSYRWIVVQSFVKEFDEFRAAVEGRKTSIASGHDGLRAVEVAERACLASAESAVRGRVPAG
jgi:predicted dehydrogenase